jgi:hypothetical protein
MACDGPLVDEVLFSDLANSASLSKADRALLVLEDVLESDEFTQCQDDFADRHCDLFDLAGDLPPEFMKIYREYVALVESALLQKVQETIPDFDFEELIPVIKEHKGDDGFLFAGVFEILNAALDFTEFRALMASYKRGTAVSLDVQTVRLGAAADD